MSYTKVLSNIIFSAVLTLMLCTGAFSFATITQAAGEIEIDSWEDLANINNDLSADYLLMNDLGPADTGYDTYASSSANMGVGWIAQGNGEPFTGTFDGQGHTISGLNIHTNQSYQGLFARAADATIRDLNLADVHIIMDSGPESVGAVVGHAEGLVLEDITVDGSIEGEAGNVGGVVGYIYDYSTDTPTTLKNIVANVSITIDGNHVGGLVGQIEGSAVTIQGSRAEGDVYGNAYVGGLVGGMEDGVIRESVALGDVTGDSDSWSVGGLSGYIDQGFVFSSYATGDVFGYSRVGGLIGEAYYGVVSHTFSFGAVTTGEGGYDIGGLIGESDEGAEYSISSSAWNTQVNGELSGIADGQPGIGVVGLETADFTDPEVFAALGWDFENVWEDGDTYPELQESPAYFTGAGTEEDPYEIGDSCAQLQSVTFFPDAYFELTDDVDCSDTENWNDGAGFMGIAYPFDGYKFSGDFDGNDHTIDGIFIDSADSDYTGLFRYIDVGAHVYDVTIDNASISAGNYIGVLAGGLGGTVENVHATGYIQGNYTVGGLVGVHADDYGLSNSSPLVYTWDGEKYTYVADVGEMITRGTEGEDFTVIDSNKLVPKDDVYSMKISQEYNEIVYYDKLSLMLFEHEPGYTVVEPMLRSVTVDSLTTVSDTPSHPLLACTDMYDHDCLNDLKDYDDKWSYKDDSEVNDWILDFGDLSGAERIQLVLRAARDYEATADYDHRTVSVMGPDGEWVQIYGRKELGSDGSPRLRTIDLTGKFLTDDYRVKFGFDRLRVNYVAIDTSAEQPFTVEEIAPSKADLSFRGYTAIDKTYFNNHDYDNYSALPPELFASQSGSFTRYGDVVPLLEDAEDHFVVMHHGDHMDIEFPYTGAVTAGKERSYILFSDVVYKHATEETGRTVLPLPYQGMESYPIEGYPMTPENIEYLNTWNTRVIEGPVSAGSTIIDSSSDVDVIGSQNVGGLVGVNEKLITGSYATGYVYGSSQSVGGLVGYQGDGGQIEESYAMNTMPADESIIVEGEAPVEGYCNVGGLVGAMHSESSITNSFARSNVYVANDCGVGALIGEMGSGIIEDTYATGQVINETGSFLGGFIGWTGSNTIIQSFWNSEINTGLEGCGVEEGEEDDCDIEGALVGTSTAEMKTLGTYTTNLGEGSWDFETIWGINDTDNEGYPFFRWQGYTHEGEPEPVYGCTDEDARNYDPEATVDDDSCTYRQRSSGGGGGTAVAIAKNIGENTPAVDNAALIANLQAQLAILMQQLAALTGETSTPAAPVSTVRDLEYGMEGEDVKMLQQVLINANAGPKAQALRDLEGSPTIYFVNYTEEALIEYQLKYGITPATGYWGEKTRTQMKAAGLGGLWW